jgi:alcohol dehydrogenase, propanol-preferring
MRAVQVVEYNAPPRINNVPTPQPRSGELIVKVAVASHCHTDNMVAAGALGTKLPVTVSHEGAGTVAAVGDGVTAFKPGDRVMCGLPVRPCGLCHDCTGPDESYRQYCRQTEGHVGVHRDGCMAEYVQVDEKFTDLLPDNVSFLSAAPLACAGRTVWRGIQQAGLKAGQWIAIVGSGGGLGHLGVQFAKALGLRVIGIDAKDEGVDVTRRYGADIVLDARKGKVAVAQEARQATNGQGADSTIVISDASEATAVGASVTRMHGTLIQIALPESIVVPFQELVFRDIRL